MLSLTEQILCNSRNKAEGLYPSMATSKSTYLEEGELHAPLLEPYGCSEGKRPCLAILRNLGGNLMESSIVVGMSMVCKKVGGVIMKDTAKTIHALKMAMALSFAFLLVLLREPYEKLGEHVIWAIMTVVVVFEFTIGATLSKGLNRGVGTLFAALLAIGVGELADCMSGGVGYPILIGFSVFLTGGVVTFGMLWPSLKSYEYGFRSFLLTFSLIMVDEYRGDNPFNTAVNRFLIILLGAVIGISVNVFVLPCWAGDELHCSVVANFHGVADSLEACVNEYLCGTIHKRFSSKLLTGKTVDNPLYDGYITTLASASKEESLAGFASWEPPHGQFTLVNKYPWKQYVKVGAVLRHCAYSIVALHGCLQSAIQAPLRVRKLFENEIRAVGTECASVLRKLGSQLECMQKVDSASLLRGVECAIDQLQKSLYLRSYLLIHSKDTRDYKEHKEKRVSVSVIPEVSRLTHDNALEHGIFAQTCSSDDLELAHVRQRFSGSSKKKRISKMHSWPSRREDDLDFAKEPLLEQSVRVLESASALSVGTFTTLLMEVALRLDYVVEAVEELGKGAGFADSKDKEHADIDIEGRGFHVHAIGAGWQTY